MIDIVGTIIVVALASAAAWYLSKQIFKPMQEAREAHAIRASAPVVKRIDIWQGFEDAHRNHPPVFEENDSWGLEAESDPVKAV